jgi:hypothetical protein
LVKILKALGVVMQIVYTQELLEPVEIMEQKYMSIIIVFADYYIVFRENALVTRYVLLRPIRRPPQAMTVSLVRHRNQKTRIMAIAIHRRVFFILFTS